ncbi:MAG TPA: ATP-binding cassette domain-containing protein [Clostridiaceae bacterium]|jgi:putative ABC transport system permease protein|nr:ATP-binding cassette domain-containing protein [Clostridiaceae bacterium]HOA30365.1 ATP-binding cassette domain-containing protein [Clostridia bacterium]
MLKLVNVTKSYVTGDFKQVALNNVSLAFRENEFVAILGPSGGGKTTLLNIIGGLDRYDSGEMYINGRPTSDFKGVEWDAYRNNSIGFVFQNYNLISHISILENVEMGMTLSGMSASERRERALRLLDRVGLKDHVKKKPNQLSGGQMQRVAIARALANDPDIILADEPTGALDSETGVQILDLIKEIAKNKLVIMVTHNPELANKYATRIVNLVDGRIVSDSNPYEEEEHKQSGYKLKMTAMNFFTALKLSFNNIKTKKFRTILTSFAASIGIIGIALILALSNGFQIEIDKFEENTMSGFPIIIGQQATTVDIADMGKKFGEENRKYKEFTDKKEVIPFDRSESELIHMNNITEEYIEYLKSIDPNLLLGTTYTRMTSLNLLKLDRDNVAKIVSMQDLDMSVLPKKFGEEGFVEKNYDILYGKMPENKNELLLVVDKFNRLDKRVLETLGFSTYESIAFEDIIGTELRAIPNNDYYVERDGFFTLVGNPADMTEIYNRETAIPLKIVGILRIKKDKMLDVIRTGVAYSEELMEYILEDSENSDIAKAQREADYNVLTGQPFDLTTEKGKEDKENVLRVIGANSVPLMITIFPRDFDSKDDVLAFLDAYNEGKDSKDRIIYTDMAEQITKLTKKIIDSISIVLIAFASISLFVSSIMIGIITYISVLERTKEIGILRSLGARKSDITLVFNAETFIIGVFSGLIGIAIASLLVIPTNMIIANYSNLENVAKLSPLHAIILILVSLFFTIVGGFIPSLIAAKKDPVEALRTE